MRNLKPLAATPLNTRPPATRMIRTSKFGGKPAVNKANMGHKKTHPI